MSGPAAPFAPDVDRTDRIDRTDRPHSQDSSSGARAQRQCSRPASTRDMLEEGLVRGEERR